MKLSGIVEKGWGYEDIFCTNDLYCGKYLCFTDAGAKFSMHFHLQKDETWRVVEGKFEVKWIDTKNAKIHTVILEKDSTWHNPPLLPHQLTCLEPGKLLEISTPDSVEDNYRVMPGDSQAS